MNDDFGQFIIIKKSNFNELKDHQDLRKLAVELFKVSKGLSPKIVTELFQCRDQIPYELRQNVSFRSLWFIQFLVVSKVLHFLGRRYGHWCLMK